MVKCCAGLLLFCFNSTDGTRPELHASTKVFLVAGQSNAVGFGGNAADLPLELREPLADVSFWYDIGRANAIVPNDRHLRPTEGTQHWVPLAPQAEWGGRAAFDKPWYSLTGQHITVGHGAEIAAGHLLHNWLDEEVAIIKFAWNGSALANVISEVDWNPNSVNEYWDWWQAEVNTAIDTLKVETGDVVEFAGILWMQGESDLLQGTTRSNAYAGNLSDLINATRDAWGPGTTFVIAKLHEDLQHAPSFGGLTSPEILDQVQQAQEHVTTLMPGTYLLNLDDVPLAADGVHFDSAGLNVVGERFALAYARANYAAGDFDFDGDLDLNDLDKLVQHQAAGDRLYDLNSDGLTDRQDIESWLDYAASEHGFPTAYQLGDANLDGRVDSGDFSIWFASRFTTGGNWSGGDFNGDGRTDGADFNLWNANKGSSIREAALPEPGGTSTTVFVTAMLLLLYHRSSIPLTNRQISASSDLLLASSPTAKITT